MKNKENLWWLVPVVIFGFLIGKSAGKFKHTDTDKQKPIEESHVEQQFNGTSTELKAASLNELKVTPLTELKKLYSETKKLKDSGSCYSHLAWPASLSRNIEIGNNEITAIPDDEESASLLSISDKIGIKGCEKEWKQFTQKAKEKGFKISESGYKIYWDNHNHFEKEVNLNIKNIPDLPKLENSDICLNNIQKMNSQIAFSAFENFPHHYISEKKLNRLSNNGKCDKDIQKYIDLLNQNGYTIEIGDKDKDITISGWDNFK